MRSMVEGAATGAGVACTHQVIPAKAGASVFDCEPIQQTHHPPRVIPAKAGTQLSSGSNGELGSRLRGNDTESERAFAPLPHARNALRTVASRTILHPSIHVVSAQGYYPLTSSHRAGSRRTSRGEGPGGGDVDPHRIGLGG